MSARWIWWRRIFLAASLLVPFLLLSAANRADWRIWTYAVGMHGLLLYAMLQPQSCLLGPITNRLKTDRKLVWLTIDDGPSADTLPLARLLQERDVRATFFLRGTELTHRPEVAPALVAAGHGVANHTMHHPAIWFWSYLPWKLGREIDECAEVFVRAGVQPQPWFRCPAGIKNPFLHSLLRRRGLHLVGWTVRAYDGVRCDAPVALKRICKELRPGAIILVHEGKNDTAGNPASVNFLLQLVEQIRLDGYDFTQPDDLNTSARPDRP